MISKLNLQISQLRHTPQIFKNLLTEFLDSLVELVAANKPFISLLEVSPTSSFYLHAPEVGGSSALLAPFLQKDFPLNSITLLSDQLDKKRLAQLQSLSPETFKNIYLQKMTDLPKEGTSPRILISINKAHLLTDTELGDLLYKMSQTYDQILIGEGNNKSLRQVIGMLILSPFMACLLTPFVKPFRFSRFIFTYPIPVMPLMIAWDGIIALFLIRTPEKILTLARQHSGPQWNWRAGKHPNNRGGFVIYLHGKKSTKPS